MGAMFGRVLPLAAACTLLASACSGGEVGSSTSQPRFAPTIAQETTTPQPEPPAWAVIPRERYLDMWKRPGRPNPAFVFDSKLTGVGLGRMLVVGERETNGERWLRVKLPIRPNGAAAWARETDVRLVPRYDELKVDLSKRTLEHFRDGELIDRFRVGIGRPEYPTALGTFYVWQKVNFDEWYGPYGIYALGLSGFSPVLLDWPGGGRMAIHGTADPSDRGREVSHGCVRVYNEGMKLLRRIPLGTPVVIQP